MRMAKPGSQSTAGAQASPGATAQPPTATQLRSRAAGSARGLGVDTGALPADSANASNVQLVEALRQYQETDVPLGPFFQAMHAFIDRTLEEFFYDTPLIDHPVIGMQKDRRSRFGFYTTKDGYALANRINLNPYAHKTGLEVAETCAHELVHLWQAHVGRPCNHNYHNDEFHRRMSTMGIRTEGRNGKHVGYTTGQWQAWIEENEDLRLGEFILPGMDPEPKTVKMFKHTCPGCKASFRGRKPLDVTCNKCNEIFQVTRPR